MSTDPWDTDPAEHNSRGFIARQLSEVVEVALYADDSEVTLWRAAGAIFTLIGASVTVGIVVTVLWLGAVALFGIETTPAAAVPSLAEIVTGYIIGIVSTPLVLELVIFYKMFRGGL